MAYPPPSAVKPSAASVGASWAALALGIVAFVVGLWNATMTLSEKGFYGLAFALALFAAVAVQKNVRDALQHGEPSQAASYQSDTTTGGPGGLD
ncbi:YiaA/YiaB family inner membrane protein [Actinoplanes sp. NEAU-A12]|uniref:YiaA/YiaB family inner membrane protein n=1 Tax=Actinoplanes sandaracinus TaxID=3045177 RepID=A0ABT6WPU3_9ACTN|nr:YiaA/YiaB family inner membrane protein [Actinoplanes sandaracinus]MDI6101706.1 YiaA/YiaB family inner membrane protein [Actinoplanes sandaracinus]